MEENKKNKILNVPNLRFSDDNWNQTILGETCTMIGGGTPSTKNAKYWSGNIPWVSSADILEDSFNINISRRITQEAIKQSATKECPPNSILLVSRVGVGKIGIFDGIVCTSQDFTNIVSYPFDKLFFAYYLQKILRKKATEAQGTSIKGITSKEIRALEIYVPHKEIQFKIGNLLNLIDLRIATQSKIIEDLKLLMKRSIDSLLHSKLQAKNIELRQLLTERKDKNKFALSVFSVAVEEGIVNQEEHLGRSFAAKDTSNYNVVKYGDVVYTKSPTGLFPFGIVKQSFNREDVAVSPLYGIYEPKTMAVGNYLHYYFLNPINTNNYLHPLVNKGAKNTMNITNQRFLDGKIAFPESYIESLVGLLSSIKTKFDFNVKLLEKYQLQKKYLLDNLFI